MVDFKFNNNKLKINLERRSDFASFYQVFVERSYPHLINKICEGDTVIDAGANIGVFTILASVLVGKTGQVIAIEPDPENLRLLRKNIQLNNLTNVQIIDKALYKESGIQIKFIQDGVMLQISMDNGRQKNYIEVKTITLDDIVNEFEIKPKILKMDIEGAEKFALLEARKTMEYVNYFEMEIHSEEDYNVLMQYAKEFKLIEEPAESLRNVIKFILKNPLKFLNLEYHNRFRTTQRILSSKIKKHKASKYPLVIYGEKILDYK